MQTSPVVVSRSAMMKNRYRPTIWVVMAAALFLPAASAQAQLDSWRVDRPVFDFAPTTVTVRELGASLGHLILSLPSNICVGGSAMSADGATFYFQSGTELRRFDTASRSPMASVPTPVPCPARMHISPDDRWWYFVTTPFQGPAHYWIVEATTREVVHEASLSSLNEIAFTPDGAIRVHVH